MSHFRLDRKEASNPLQTLLNRCMRLEMLHINEIWDYGDTLVQPRGPCAHLRHLHISNGRLPLIMPEYLVELEELDIHHTSDSSAVSSVISAVVHTLQGFINIACKLPVGLQHCRESAGQHRASEIAECVQLSPSCLPGPWGL